jgi:hypothetical protein
MKLQLLHLDFKLAAVLLYCGEVLVALVATVVLLLASSSAKACEPEAQLAMLPVAGCCGPHQQG